MSLRVKKEVGRRPAERRSCFARSLAAVSWCSAFNRIPHLNYLGSVVIHQVSGSQPFYIGEPFDGIS